MTRASYWHDLTGWLGLWVKREAEIPSSTGILRESKFSELKDPHGFGMSFVPAALANQNVSNNFPHELERHKRYSTEKPRRVAAIFAPQAKV